MCGHLFLLFAVRVWRAGKVGSKRDGKFDLIGPPLLFSSWSNGVVMCVCNRPRVYHCVAHVACRPMDIFFLFFRVFLSLSPAWAGLGYSRVHWVDWSPLVCSFLYRCRVPPIRVAPHPPERSLPCKKKASQRETWLRERERVDLLAAISDHYPTHTRAHRDHFYLSSKVKFFCCRFCTFLIPQTGSLPVPMR